MGVDAVVVGTHCHPGRDRGAARRSRSPHGITRQANRQAEIAQALVGGAFGSRVGSAAGFVRLAQRSPRLGSRRRLRHVREGQLRIARRRAGRPATLHRRRRAPAPSPRTEPRQMHRERHAVIREPHPEVFEGLTLSKVAQAANCWRTSVPCTRVSRSRLRSAKLGAGSNP